MQQRTSIAPNAATRCTLPAGRTQPRRLPTIGRARYGTYCPRIPLARFVSAACHLPGILLAGARACRQRVRRWRSRFIPSASRNVHVQGGVLPSRRPRKRCSTSSFTMARPRPDPVYVLVPAFASCANGSNACCWNSGLMPMSVSAHVISNVATSSVAESSRHVMARNMQGNSALRGRLSAAISRAGTRWEGAAFSISITNNKAGDVSLLRLAMPPCLHVIRESTIKRKKDEPQKGSSNVPMAEPKGIENPCAARMSSFVGLRPPHSTAHWAVEPSRGSIPRRK